MALLSKAHTLQNRAVQIGFFAAVLVGLLMVTSHLFAVTTLSTNISTDGSITASSTIDISSSSTLYGTLQLGGYAGDDLNYNIIAANGGTTASRTTVINTSNDLFVGGSIETDGLGYFDGGFISAASTTFSASTTIVGGLNIGIRDQAGAYNDTISEHLTATSSIDFGVLAGGHGCETNTISVAGAAGGDTVVLGAPATAISTSTVLFAWVSSAGTVSVRACNTDKDVATSDPSAGVYRVDVWRHAANTN